MTKPANIRLKVLKAARSASHRYDAVRAGSMTISLAILVAVPLTGVARVDAWRGNHYLLYHPAPFKHALAGVLVGIAGMYVVTFLSNVVAGRMFCGWGCPVGQISRFGEAVGTPGLKPRQKLAANARGALFSGAFVLAMMAWWVDLSVLWAAPPRGLAPAWAVLVAGVAGAYAHGRWWRWEFCKQVCPIGLYYSFVSPAKWYGVYFRNEQSTCIECDACDNICPVGLTPRDLMALIASRGGVSVADAPGRNHCLECGDCIRACERMIQLKGHGPVPLLLGYHRGPQRVDAEASQPVK